MSTSRQYTQATPATIMAHMNKIYAAVQEVETGIGVNGYRGVKSDILDEIKKFNKLLAKIDYGILHKPHQDAIGKAVFDGMTRVKELITVRAHTQNWDGFSKKARRRIYRQQTIIQKIVNEQEKIPKLPTETAATLVGWTPAGEISPVIFPHYATDNTTIQTVYTSLRASWEQASLKILSTEDTYLLVALATNYVPESIALLKRLSQHSPTAKLRCEQMFLEQLNLMQQQVDVLLAKESDTILSAMQAHTRFLAQKVVVKTT